MNDCSLIDEIREKIELFIPKLIEFRYSEEKKDEDRQAILLHHKEITNDILKLSEDKQIELVRILTMILTRQRVQKFKRCFSFHIAVERNSINIRNRGLPCWQR